MTYSTNPKTGEKISLLGYGAMRLPDAKGASTVSADTGIDEKEVQAHVDYAIEHGVNYFDTSPAYCGGHSEGVMGRALARHPRSSWKIATKLSNFAKTQFGLDACKAMFENSLRELKTDHIDYYLLHSVGQEGMDIFLKRHVENGAIEWLMKEREAGRIRNLGFSFHGSDDVFEWLMKEHDRVHWDFAQLQLNYVDWNHGAELDSHGLGKGLVQPVRGLYEQLVARKIPTVIMEPLLGGRLARFNYTLAEHLKPLDPEASLASWAFRFAGNLPNVMCVLSGMTYRENIEENCRTFSPLKPISAKEMAVLEAAAKAFLSDKTIPCNACNYCMPCPYGLDIPGILTCWNRARAERWDDARFLREYEKAVPQLRRADHCTGCGRCSPHCPQGIDVPAKVQFVDDYIEKVKRGLK